MFALAFAALLTVDPVVQEHLLHAATTLRTETPGVLSPELRTRRLDLLDALEIYARDGRYPQHAVPSRGRPRGVLPPRRFQPDDVGMRAPLFVDDRGVHCAVGHLVSLDRPDLVARVVAEANDEWLAEMPVPELGSWAEEHGFTLEELALVQPAYGPPDCGDLEGRPGSQPLESSACGPVDVSVDHSFRCLSCEGNALLWPYLKNAGEAVRATVEVTKPSGCVERLAVSLPARTAVPVGPFSVPLAREGMKPARVRVIAEGNCSVSVEASETGGSEERAPSCSGDEPNTADGISSDCDSGGGCASARASDGANAATAAAIALLLLRRRKD